MNGDMNQKLAHRDDFTIEQVEAIKNRMSELYPGMKVVFAGDAPEGSLSQEVVEKIADIESAHEQSLVNGCCIDCGCKIDNWPPPSFENDSEEPAFHAWWKKNIDDAGWRVFLQGEGENTQPAAFQCSVCDILEGQQE